MVGGVGGQDASAALSLEKRLRNVGVYFGTHKGAIILPPKKRTGIFMRDFSPLPRCKRVLRSFGILRSVER